MILPAQHEHVLAYLCRRQQDKLLVLLNLTDGQAVCTTNHPALPGAYEELFTGKKEQVARKQTFSIYPGDHKVCISVAVMLTKRPIKLLAMNNGIEKSGT